MVPPGRARSVATRRATRRATKMPRANGRGCGKNKQGGCGTHPVHFPLLLFGLFVLDRTT